MWGSHPVQRDVSDRCARASIRAISDLFDFSLQDILGIQQYVFFCQLTKVRLRRDEVGSAFRHQAPTYRPAVAGGLPPQIPRRPQAGELYVWKSSVHPMKGGK